MFAKKKRLLCSCAALCRVAAELTIASDYAMARYERRERICRKCVANSARAFRLPYCARKLRVGARFAAGDFHTCKEDCPLERSELC